MRFFGFFIFLCSFSLFLPVGGFCADKAFKVVVFDMAQVVQSSLAGKKLSVDYGNRKVEIDDRSRVKEQDFNLRDKELSEQKGVLSQGTYDSKLQEFNRDLIEARKQVREMINDLDSAYSHAQEVIVKRMESIVGGITKRDSLDLILPKLPAPYMAVGLKDITKEVVDALDKELLSVPLEAMRFEASKEKGDMQR